MAPTHSLWILYLLICAHTKVSAFRLYPCDASGYHDAVENNATTFHCDGYTGSVEWRYGPPAGSLTVISTCDDTQCTPFTAPVFTPTFISVGNSSFTSTLTSRQSAGGVYGCGGLTCRFHVIVPAVVPQVRRTITRTDQGFSVNCSADVTRVFSSKGFYSCYGQMGPNTKVGTVSLQPSPSDTSDTSDRTGTCDVTFPLPSQNGDFRCDIIVSPGDTKTSSDVIKIERPSVPEMRCPSAPMPENTTFICTCTADVIGQPGGRLTWYTGLGDDVSTKVVSGSYDVSTLLMMWTARGSDNLRKFRCVNQWVEQVSPANDFILHVATSPKEPSPSGLGARAAVGVAMAVVVVVVVVVVVWLWRRHWVLPCAAPSAENESPVVNGPGEAIGFSGGHGTDENNERNSQYDYPAPENNYEGLRGDEVGLTSVYSDLSPYVNSAMDGSTDTGPAYDNTGPKDGMVY